MTLKTVGLLSPGNMGSHVAGVLISNGLQVLTCLNQRSDRTRRLAEQAGIGEVPDYETLVLGSDMILSILVPAQAGQAAAEVAAALSGVDTGLIYADCNAISPQSVRQVGEIIVKAGGLFIDASIIGPPPRNEDSPTRFYCSGPNTSAFEELGRFGLDVRPIGPDIGRASALKMCYAALTKGLTALSTELLTAARALDISEELKRELESSQPAIYRRMELGIPTMPERAGRWIGEMEEIAATFAHVGLTPRILEGAADMYRFVGKTPPADQTPENRDPSLNLEKLISIFAEYLIRN